MVPCLFSVGLVKLWKDISLCLLLLLLLLSASSGVVPTMDDEVSVLLLWLVIIPRASGPGRKTMICNNFLISQISGPSPVQLQIAPSVAD